MLDLPTELLTAVARMTPAEAEALQASLRSWQVTFWALPVSSTRGQTGSGPVSTCRCGGCRVKLGAGLVG